MSETQSTSVPLFNYMDHFKATCAEEHICNRCKRVIYSGAYEVCWFCQADLCAHCWDTFGHCGHTEADEQNDRARMVQQSLPEYHSCNAQRSPQSMLCVYKYTCNQQCPVSECADDVQQRQPRPFVRVDEMNLIFTDDFIFFGLQNSCLVGVDRQTGEINRMHTYDTVELAQSALDTIQAAIEHWKEPQCTCGNKSTMGEEQKQLLTVGEQQEIKDYIRWRFWNQPEPDWQNIASWLVELEEHRPGSPITKRKKSNAP